LSLAIKAMQIKPTMTYHFTLRRMALMKKKYTENGDDNVKKLEPL
jgi:hypothetical protein